MTWNASFYHFKANKLAFLRAQEEQRLQAERAEAERLMQIERENVKVLNKSPEVNFSDSKK